MDEFSDFSTADAANIRDLVADGIKDRFDPIVYRPIPAHLVDEVLPKRPIRQWVLSVPFQLRYLFATNPQVMSRVLTIVNRVISTFLIKRAGMTTKSGAQSGGVTLIQRIGSALNLKSSLPHVVPERCL